MDDYFFDLETKWRNEQKSRNFGKEILELMTYEETQELLQPLFDQRILKKEEFDKQYKKIARLVKKHYAPGTFEFDFSVDALWTLRYLKEDLINKEQLDQVEHFWRFNELRKQTQEKSILNNRLDFDYLIEKAKAVPIETLIKNRLRHAGTQRLICLCPFHTEKTPSFTIFTNTNTYCCFGCGAKGDVVSYYQRLFGIGFRQSVMELAK